MELLTRGIPGQGRISQAKFKPIDDALNTRFKLYKDTKLGHTCDNSLDLLLWSIAVLRICPGVAGL